MKVCSRCKIRKERVFFGSNSTSSDGKRSSCRVCDAETERMRERDRKHGGLSILPTQPSAEAHRLWMRVSADWARAVAA